MLEKEGKVKRKRESRKEDKNSTYELRENNDDAGPRQGNGEEEKRLDEPSYVFLLLSLFLNGVKGKN